MRLTYIAVPQKFQGTGLAKQNMECARGPLLEATTCVWFAYFCLTEQVVPGVCMQAGSNLI